jgi:hypothetical protein
MTTDITITTKNMNTKLLMTASAISLGAAGITLIFAPDEASRFFMVGADKQSVLFIQIIGAAYFAFAMLNWMTKDNAIGGIYNRPIAIANLTHFGIAALALVKGIAANPDLSYQWWVLTAFYTVFATAFGIVFLRHPAGEKKLE